MIEYVLLAALVILGLISLAGAILLGLIIVLGRRELKRVGRAGREKSA